MNTANLQLEGIYVTLAALLRAMCEKGVFQRDEIDALLAETERALAQDPNRPTEMRDANIDAICFPPRFLRQALRENSTLLFEEIALRVAQAKRDLGASVKE
jgi:hypothetical protein